jgi:hypothetical protein
MDPHLESVARGMGQGFGAAVRECDAAHRSLWHRYRFVSTDIPGVGLA